MFFSRFSGNYFYIVLDFQERVPNALAQSTKIGKIVWATVAIILLSIEFTPPCWSFFITNIAISSQVFTGRAFSTAMSNRLKKCISPLLYRKKACYSDLEIDSHSFIYYIHTRIMDKRQFSPREKYRHKITWGMTDVTSLQAKKVLYWYYIYFEYNTSISQILYIFPTQKPIFTIHPPLL